VQPLIDQIGKLIETTYDFRSGLLPLGRFVVGEQGREMLLDGRETVERVDGPHGASLLLRQRFDGEGWAAALYLPEALVERLERADPRRRLDAANVAPFATLVEEVDHLLTFTDRVCLHRAEVSLLELEWHAGVTKYVTLTHFVGRLRGRSRLTEPERRFVEEHLFHRGELVAGDPSVEERYRTAERLTWRFARDLRHRPPRERIRRLRRFHRAGHHEKLRRFARPA
jgi:hypothetical protein